MKAYDYLKWILIPLFIVYITIYITQATGYYEYTQHKKSIVTAENIKKFEKDVDDGKKIKIEDYMDSQPAAHKNKFSRMGQTVSRTVESVVQTSLKATFKVLSSWFDE